MNSRQFHQAGMKKCQAGKDEMQCRRQYKSSGISLWHSKILTILANFRYITKITVHSEIQIFAMPEILAMIEKFWL